MENQFFCVSCYKKVGEDYIYCFICNRKQDKLPNCGCIKNNGLICKFKTSQGACYYHKDKKK